MHFFFAFLFLFPNFDLENAAKLYHKQRSKRVPAAISALVKLGAAIALQQGIFLLKFML